MTWKFDLFVCHASEDKGSFVDTLVAELRAVGLRVWYDDFELTVGDRLRQAIDKGLLESEFGVVVLSHNFFKKKWPQDELEGMAALERDGRKVILPVWFDIDQAGVSSYSPTLAGRMAAQSALGTAQVVLDLQKAMKRERNKGTTGGPPGSSSTATRSAIAPESPAFEATTPVWMSSCFLKDDETLLQLETTGGVVDVIWRNGPQAFVRLIPSKSNAWTPKQLLVLLTKPEAPLLKPGGMGANCQWRRSKRGAVVFFAVERESITTTLRFSQVFTSGELWGVDKGLLAGMSGGERPFIPSVATERFFMDTLKNYLRFAKDALNLSLPLRFVGGLSGIEGLSITLPGNTNLLGGRVVEDEALYDASIDTYQIDPETFLMPLFERIWDACGLERPEQL